MDQQKIRSRLLNRLGIYQEAAASSRTYHESAPQRRQRLLRAHGLGPMTPSTHSTSSSVHQHLSPPDGSAVRCLLDHVVPFEEPLKYRQNYVRSSSSMLLPPTPSTKESSLSSSPSKRIQFHDRVSVVLIPMRHEYSNRIKSKIWTSRYELAELQERNVLEFTAEGWDWHDVVEDDQMFLDARSGEMVHPIHIQLLQQRELEETMMNDSHDKRLKESSMSIDDDTSVCEFVP